MSETTDPGPVAVSNRYELTQRLDSETKQLQGVRRHHFVDRASLCSTCKYSAILRQESRNARVIHCTHFGKIMPEDISECSIYLGINALSLSQMVDIATILNDKTERHQGYL